MLAQRTIKTLTQAVGVGLHSGQRVELTLRPAPVDTGIVFRRVDLAEPVDIHINALSVTDTRLASTISSGQAKVHTVEHLMSACAGLGIDNLIIDITAEEVPILDGSASSFVFLLQSAGIELQKAPKKFIRVLKTVEVREGQGENVKWAKLEPYDGYRLSFEIEFKHPAVDSTGQQVVFDMGRDVYARDIARARTFGFTKDVEMMRSNGLALGGGFAHHVATGVGLDVVLQPLGQRAALGLVVPVLGAVLDEVRHGVQPVAIQPTVEPETQAAQVVLQHRGVVEVEVRHVRAEGAEVEVARCGGRGRQVLRVSLEQPRLRGSVVPGVLAPDVPAFGRGVGPHEPAPPRGHRAPPGPKHPAATQPWWPVPF
mgnify:CR=1 FL=1